MSAFLNFIPTPPCTRMKRKMSGPVPAIIIDDDNNQMTWSMPVKMDKERLIKSKLESSMMELQRNGWWFCELCKAVDIKEVIAFLIWELLILSVVILGVCNWIFFFKYVVEPEEYPNRTKWGGVWILFTLAFLYYRHLIRIKSDIHIISVLEHAEIFVTASLIMMFAANIAFYLHIPSSTPLRDLGFMLIPAQADDSLWRPVSDILTAGVPILFMLQSCFMTRENRCRLVSSFFRIATISYLLRMITISLTSLPGPAPHCRPGNPSYMAPESWIDIITRLGPMFGKYDSCGDLIFSGHMAYTNTALLLYLRTLDRYFPRFSGIRWILGAMYLFLLASLCVAGRKHYSVDVTLGIMISTLVFFHFEHGWVPDCFQKPYYERNGIYFLNDKISMDYESGELHSMALETENNEKNFLLSSIPNTTGIVAITLDEE